VNVKKDIKDLKIGIFVPCYKRPEYTAKCIKALEAAQEYKNVSFYLVDDGSGDETHKLLSNSSLPSATVIVHTINVGLRRTTLTFFEWARGNKLDIIGIVGNDVTMPKNWLDVMLEALTKSDLDVASCNYLPSNPAFTQGYSDGDSKYRIANNIVGLWFMDRRLTDGILFEDADLCGIRGSVAIMSQIKIEKEPKIGWVTEVQAEDIGHWSGDADGHIKSKEHEEYYSEVGRRITWTANNEGNNE